MFTEQKKKNILFELPKQEKTDRQIPDLLHVPNEKGPSLPARAAASGRAAAGAHRRPRPRRRLPRPRQAQQQRVAVPVRPSALQDLLGLPHRQHQVAGGRRAPAAHTVGVPALGRHAGEAAQRRRQAPDHHRDGDTVAGAAQAPARRPVPGEDAVPEAEGCHSIGAAEDGQRWVLRFCGGFSSCVAFFFLFV